MHMIHLGFGRDVCASALVEALETGELQGEGGGDPNNVLKSTWIELKQRRTQHKLQFSTPTFSLQRLGRRTRRTYPVLDSQRKAAHIKILLAFLTKLMSDIALRGGGERAQKRACMVFALARILNIWDRGGFPFLSPAEAEETFELGYDFLKLYSCLAAEALSRRTALYRCIPKMHFFVHLIHHVRLYHLNPRYTSAFLDEDLMGRASRIGRACAQKTFLTRVMERYLLIRAFRWQRQRKAFRHAG